MLDGAEKLLFLKAVNQWVWETIVDVKGVDC